MSVLGIDVGGTFTDAVLLGRRRCARRRCRRRPAGGVGSRRGRPRSARSPVRRALPHGTTVATNALLERRGRADRVRRHAGFEHLLHLRRQNRAHLYRLCVAPPDAARAARALPRRPRSGSGRTACSAARPRDAAGSGDAEAIAVCLLFSFRDPSHERAVADELRRRHPGAHVVASHEARARVPRVRARLDDGRRRLPRAGRSARLPARARGRRCAAAGLPEPLVMRSSGGVASIAEAAAHPASILRLGSRRRCRRRRARRAARRRREAIAFDMGGTSTDVCLLVGGRGRARGESASSAGFPSGCPRSTVHTVGAGGGSIVRRDAGGAIRVGPESARREPGPACYGRRRHAANRHRREPPARAAAGTSCPEASLLDRDAAARALEGIDPAAVVDVVNAEMLRALRVVSVERGHDPRDFALVAFGGAGPLHACALAEELGMRGGARARGGRRPLRARARRERRAARPRRSHVCPLEEVRRAAGGGRGRPPLPGPVVRADRSARARARRPLPRRARGALRLRRPRRAIELVAVRTAEITPGPEVSVPERRDATPSRGRRWSSSPARPAGCRPAGAARRRRTGRWCCER